MKVKSSHPLCCTLLSLTLVFLLLLQSTTYLIVFKTQQRQIRKEIKGRIKAGIAERDLVLLKIPLSLHEQGNPLFQSIDKNEFRYNGTMYDIVHQELRGDTCWYHCISDLQETALFANLDRLVQDDMNQNGGRKEQREKILRLLGTLFCDDTITLLPVQCAGYNNTTFYSFTLKTWTDKPPTPPPHPDDHTSYISKYREGSFV